MMVFYLKDEVKEVMKEFIEDGSVDFKKLSTEHIVLDPNLVNVLTIDVSQLPFGAVGEYLLKYDQIFKDLGYRVVLIPKRS